MKYLEDILTAKQRKLFYAVFGLIGVGLGATSVGFATAAEVPAWLLTVNAVYGFLGGAFGATANANTTPQTREDAI